LPQGNQSGSSVKRKESTLIPASFNTETETPSFKTGIVTHLSMTPPLIATMFKIPLTTGFLNWVHERFKRGHEYGSDILLKIRIMANILLFYFLYSILGLGVHLTPKGG